MRWAECHVPAPYELKTKHCFAAARARFTLACCGAFVGWGLGVFFGWLLGLFWFLGGGVSIISSQEDSRFILIFFSILKK